MTLPAPDETIVTVAAVAVPSTTLPAPDEAVAAVAVPSITFSVL